MKKVWTFPMTNRTQANYEVVNKIAKYGINRVMVNINSPIEKA